MEFDKRFKQFPLWGRIIAWCMALSIVGVLAGYAYLHGPALLATVATTVTDLLP